MSFTGSASLAPPNSHKVFSSSGGRDVNRWRSYRRMRAALETLSRRACRSIAASRSSSIMIWSRFTRLRLHHLDGVM